MIRFVGDINYSDGFFDLGFGIGSRIRNGEDPFNNIDFNQDDIYIGNFECVCSEKSKETGIRSKYFRIPPKYLKNVDRFNMYGVANNHIMQHGVEAYNDTLAHINSCNSIYIGDSSKKAIRFSHNDYKVGIVNFSFRHENFSMDPMYWYLPSISEIENELETIKDCELRIAYIHWGYEYMNKPSFDQQIIAKSLIDRGYNLIIGMHSHVLQGFEMYKNGYIFYSLGNFLFNMPYEDCRWSCLLNIDFLKAEKKIVIGYDYIELNKKGYPELRSEEYVPEEYCFEYLNSKIKSISNEDYFKEVNKTISAYRKNNYRFILKSIFKYRPNDILLILMEFIKRRIRNK